MRSEGAAPGHGPAPSRRREVSPEARSLPALLDGWAGQRPGRVLFTFADRSGTQTERLTWRDFSRRSAAIAAALSAADVRSGDRVLILHPPGIELVAALFACMRIGALAAIAPVTSAAGLGADRVARRIRAIRSDCDPFIALGLAAQQDAAAQVLPIRFLATDRVTDAGPDRCPAANQPLAFLQYTSGSTGTPRGVAITHANIIANARALIDHAPIGATWLPMFHDMGLIGHYLFPVVLGGACHGMSAADFLRRPEAWLHLVTRHRATYAAAPPFGLDHLLRRWERAPDCMAGIDLSSLRVLMIGAEPVPPELMARAEARLGPLGLKPGALVAGYGLAEATLAVTRGGSGSFAPDPAALRRGRVRPADSGAGPVRRLSSCGRPLRNLGVSIVCPGTARPLPPDRIGEIRVEGASVAPGHWGGAAAEGQGVLKTGDLGFLRDGALFVCGRADDVIIRNGEKFHPQDIEAAAGTDPCAAFTDAEGRSTLLVELRRGREVCAETLARRVAAATGLELDRIVLTAPRSIRRTTSGKIARADTRRRLRDGKIRCHENWLRAEAHVGDDDDGLDWLRRQLRRDPALGARSLVASGIGSLQLVSLQLALERLAEHGGLGERAGRLDGPALQSATCAQVLDLADALDRGARRAAGRCLDLIARSGSHAEARDRACMLSDAALPLAGPVRPCSAEPDAILLTGATGFLGAHLLAALLRETSLPILVLCRGRDDADARRRVLDALGRVRPGAEVLARRIEVLRGDLAAPGLGLDPAQRADLRARRLAIYHNAATVDYVRNYDTLRPVNVAGTKALLDLALAGTGAHFHHVSSTFVFGWTRRPVLYETDDNAAMEGLDFGYSQSKWVAERLVARARDAGLACTIYRPSLISVPHSLRGDVNDVAARLLAFMIRHRTAVDTPNQLSLVPVDTTAHNLVRLSLQPQAAGRTYHMTADRYYSLTELTRRISREFGYRFNELPIPAFIDRLNRLAGPEDPVYPLLDFFNRCAPQIAAMTLKRYDNRAYRAARDRNPGGRPDPDLSETAARLVAFLDEQGWLDPGRPGQAAAAF